MKSFFKKLFSKHKKFTLITEEERIFLLNWIQSKENKFIPNQVSPNRKYFPFESSNDADDHLYLLSDIKNRIVKKEKIKNYISDPLIGDFISWITNNGRIHAHKDCCEIGKLVRYNLAVSLPDVGGRPIYDGELIDLKEKECVRCDCTSIHETEVVVGNKPRIVVSFGFLIFE
jgi:hypothetical protein